MTCGFCQYEFCWACGGSASSGDNHFSGEGCGVRMMDDTVKPGDHLKFRGFRGIVTNVTNFIKGLLAALCIISCAVIIYPLWLVFFIPCSCATGFYENHRRYNHNMRRYKICGFLNGLMGFCFGLVLNICFIPVALCATACGILGFIIFLTGALIDTIKRRCSR